MALSPSMLWSACRLTSHGDLRGTASIISVASESLDRVRWPYVVTADHVVRNLDGIEIEVPNGFTGELQQPVALDEWRRPFEKIDLAIAPFDVTKVENCRAAYLERNVAAQGAPQMGSTLYYIGVFAPRDVPMVRGGVVGTPAIPIKKTNPDYEYNGHLVDCRSYDGFSGSPCYAELEYPVLNKIVKPPIPWGPELEVPQDNEYGDFVSFVLLAGMFTAHYDDEDSEDNPENAASRYGVGIMLPISYIWEALMTEDARAERREWDRQKQAERDATHFEPRDAGTGTPNDEFDRFENLTRQLVQTPKPDGER